MPTVDCSVCDVKTSQVCSKCRVVPFCSSECLKALWPTHKDLCGKDTSTFCVPPLSQDERFLVFEHRYELFIDELLDRITVGGELLEEPRLSACTTLARTQIFVPHRSARIAIKNVRSASWNCLANKIAGLVCYWKDDLTSPETSPFRHLNGFMRLYLVQATLNVGVFGPLFNSHIFSSLLLSCHRLATIDTDDISSLDRDAQDRIAFARRSAGRSLDEFNEQQKPTEKEKGSKRRKKISQ
ncbi:hypothetical protein JCM5353_002131 [Sporobolomyces roseus]